MIRILLFINNPFLLVYKLYDSARKSGGFNFDQLEPHEYFAEKPIKE